MTTPFSSTGSRQTKNVATNTSSSHAAQRTSRPQKESSKNHLLVLSTPLKLDSSACLSSKATVIGSYPITVRSNAVIHPYAVLDSTLGPIEIGEECIVWELALIGASRTPPTNMIASKSKDPQTFAEAYGQARRTVIGKCVTMEANSTIEPYALISNNCVIEAGSHVGSCAVIGEYSRLAPLTVVSSQDTLLPYSVVFHDASSGEQHQRQNTSLRDNLQMRLLQARGHERLLRSVRAIVEPQKVLPS